MQKEIGLERNFKQDIWLPSKGTLGMIESDDTKADKQKGDWLRILRKRKKRAEAKAKLKKELKE